MGGNPNNLFSPKALLENYVISFQLKMNQPRTASKGYENENNRKWIREMVTYNMKEKLTECIKNEE